MSDSIKIKAPRPIKVSNNNGDIFNLKQFERINTEFNSLTPKIKKNTCVTQPRISSYNELTWAKSSNVFNFNEDCGESTFDRTVERDFLKFKEEDYDSLCKSEIISILKNDSFLNDSPINNDEEDNYFYEDVKTFVPPRTKNPFYKNFESTNSVEYKLKNIDNVDLDEFLSKFIETSSKQNNLMK